MEWSLRWLGGWVAGSSARFALAMRTGTRREVMVALKQAAEPEARAPRLALHRCYLPKRVAPPCRPLLGLLIASFMEHLCRFRSRCVSLCCCSARSSSCLSSSAAFRPSRCGW